MLRPRAAAVGVTEFPYKAPSRLATSVEHEGADYGDTEYVHQVGEVVGPDRHPYKPARGPPPSKHRSHRELAIKRPAKPRPA